MYLVAFGLGELGYLYCSETLGWLRMANRAHLGSCWRFVSIRTICFEHRHHLDSHYECTWQQCSRADQKYWFRATSRIQSSSRRDEFRAATEPHGDNKVSVTVDPIGLFQNLW